MDISKKINELRVEKKVKVTELAGKIGLTYAGMNKAFNTNDFKISQLQKIADALDVPISYFFNDFEVEIKDYIDTIGEDNVEYIKKFLHHKYLLFSLCDQRIYDLIANSEQWKKIEELQLYTKSYENNDIEGILRANKMIPQLEILDYFSDKEAEKVFKAINDEFIEKVYTDKLILWFIGNKLINHGQLTRIMTHILAIVNEV